MELKFRAKANIDNEWKYASNIHKVILDDTNEELWVIHPKGEKIEHLGDGYIKYRPLVIDKKTIGQYTGLKDKNGKEIYVGDIVKYTHDWEISADKEEVGVVEYYNGGFSPMQLVNGGVYYGLDSEPVYEVVGNVHDKEGENV